MICPHDWYFYGDKKGDQTWLCWSCCGLVTHSGLAGGMVLVESQPEQQAYCTEQINMIARVWARNFPGEQVPSLFK